MEEENTWLLFTLLLCFAYNKEENINKEKGLSKSENVVQAHYTHPHSQWLFMGI